MSAVTPGQALPLMLANTTALRTWLLAVAVAQAKSSWHPILVVTADSIHKQQEEAYSTLVQQLGSSWYKTTSHAQVQRQQQSHASSSTCVFPSALAHKSTLGPIWCHESAIEFTVRHRHHIRSWAFDGRLYSRF